MLLSRLFVRLQVLVLRKQRLLLTVLLRHLRKLLLRKRLKRLSQRSKLQVQRLS